MSNKENLAEAEMTWPQHAAAQGTHDKVMQVLKRHVSKLSGKSFCDVPCGAGLFSRRLHDEGVQLFSLDIEEIHPYVGPTDRRILTDANLPLPLKSNSVDVSVSIEGIEHLENPAFFLRENSRIIKDNGIIILTTPNVDSFRSRITSIWKGYPKYFNPLDLQNKASAHLLPIDMVFMHGAAARAGLEIVDVQTIPHKRDRGIAFVLQELIRPFATHWLPKEMKGKTPFYGDVIIYVMRKLGG